MSYSSPKDQQARYSAGTRIRCRDAEWLVTRVEPSSTFGTNNAVHAVGIDEMVRGHRAVFLTQLDDIELVDPRRTQPVADDSSGYRRARLFVEAQLRQMPATGMKPDPAGMGAFDPMRFQLLTVEMALKQLRPRLLLADAVGLGKTIQVGMIISELMRRRRAERILVLTRKSMLAQFQSELWNRFAIPLVRLDSEGIAKLRLRIPANRNPFEVCQRVIISIDTLKNVGSYRHFLERAHWDCVVIDEAHNVAGASVPERHLSHRLARLLSRRADSLLLTTATPHNGRPETFGRLISLLDPSAIPDPEYREYSADQIRGLFVMRFKEDVRDEVEQHLRDRLLTPLSETTARAGEAEERVYALLSEYREATKPADGERRGPALLQYGLYKQFLSSPESCWRTVEERRRRLESEGGGEAEREMLERLRQSLEGLSLSGSTRYELLKRQLRAIGWDGSPLSPRVLVFTEYRETQDALAATLAQDFRLVRSERFEDQPRQSLATIHGGYPDIHLMKTVEAFGTGSSPVRLLLATDVASEGINLHHECHRVIHYDLPWSIITLIQRNGRIDRIGQKRNPILSYLRVESTQPGLRGDGAIFEGLIRKVEEINRSTRSGESVLRLYDAEAEERYIAEAGIVAGRAGIFDEPSPAADPAAAALEEMLSGTSAEDYAAMRRMLLGEDQSPTLEASPTTDGEAPASRLHRFSDREFLIEGYRYLAETNPGYAPIEASGPMLTLTAPEDLRRRLGAPGSVREAIPGATAIPIEAWPERDEFRLTDDPNRVALAIEAARNTSGYWSKELLCTNQHPILQWIAERMLMLLPRDQCPLVVSPHLAPDEICFCMIGQVITRGGIPVIADAHGVSFFHGGRSLIRPLGEALDAAGFERLVNDGSSSPKPPVNRLIESAVELSLARLGRLWKEQQERLRPLLDAEDLRLDRWIERRHEILLKRIADLGDAHPRSVADRRLLGEATSYIDDRKQNLKDSWFDEEAGPSTRVIMVIQGR